MTIKPGKWRMRNGQMAVVEYRTDANTSWPWRGFVAQSKSGMAWKDDGKWAYQEEHEQDIIEPWIDRPTVNWSAMPAWANWVTMDSDVRWFWWAKKPVLKESALASGWFGDPENLGVIGFIPEDYRPTFAGDWKDSLVERPSA